MVICLLQGANGVHVVQLMPLPPHLASLESRLVGMFGVSLPRLSLAKKPLNECYCCVLLKGSTSRDASEGGTLPKDKKKKRGFRFPSFSKKKEK